MKGFLCNDAPVTLRAVTSGRVRHIVRRPCARSTWSHRRVTSSAALISVSSATSANAFQLTIKPLIFLLDHLSQGIFLRLDLVGACNTVLACC